jgi:hypothetical protein
MVFTVLTPVLATEQDGTRSRKDPQKLSALPGSGNYNYVELADMNHDGSLDIIAAAGGYPGGDPGGLYVYLNYNAQTIIGSSEGLPGAGNDYFGSVQAIDIDKDSNLDLVAAYESHWSRGNDKGIGIWLGNGAKGDTLTFTEATSPITENSFDSVYCADIDNDGDLDIVGASDKGIYAWVGQQSGSTLSWTEVRTGLPTNNEYTGITLGDINKDGRLDIVAGSYSSRGISVYLCSKTGTISWTEGHSDTNLKLSGNSFDTRLVDLNDDGNLDLVAGIRGGMKVYLGNGNSGDRKNWWTDVSDGLPTSSDYYQVSIEDIDKDGNLDLACNFKVWYNTGRMGKPDSYSWDELDLGVTESSTVGMYIADLNNDGYQDIVGCGWGSGVSAYLLYIEPPEPTDPDPPVEMYYKLTGIVTSSDEGILISGATVGVDDNSGLKVITGPDGKFEFELLNGSYELTVTMKDFKSAKKLVDVYGSDQTVNIQLLKISEVPESEFTLTGTITNKSSGAPIASATISLEPGGQSTITDQQGKFSITTTNGSYVLTVSSTGYEPRTSNVVVTGGDLVNDLALQYIEKTSQDPTDLTDPSDPKDSDDEGLGGETDDDPENSSSSDQDIMFIGIIVAAVVVVLVIIVVVIKSKNRQKQF